jgi:3-hydroxy-9,10-secoandrosta-1,3,5(10)-triene-9,17-dione monooxygenase reductase component
VDKPAAEPNAQPELQPEIDPMSFRQVLGHLPTGVTVVASVDDGRPVGLAAGSFFSVSLQPPLVGFCVTLTSNTWPVIERTGKFGVSVLADDQVEVCQRMASKEADKFGPVPWTAAPATGSPLVDGAVAHLDCRLDQKLQAGDHWIVIGRVLHLSLHRPEVGALVFARGGYMSHTPI